MFRRWSLARRFFLASLVILVVNGLLIGWWVGRQIERNVLQHAAAEAALFVDSIVSPALQPLAQTRHLTPAQLAALDALLARAPLRQHLVAIKIWAPDGTILYSPHRVLIGQRFPIDAELAAALQGTVSTDISDLEEPENADERQHWTRLQQVYVPVRDEQRGDVVAVTEFYQLPDALEGDIQRARLRSWGLVAVLTLATYLLLAGLVQTGSRTIARQQHTLNEKVQALSRLLDQNVRLQERVRQAAERTTALNEQALRRISADLHDGPAQALALALLRMDDLVPTGPPEAPACPDLAVVHTAVRDALHEIRAISRGLLLPQLETLALPEVVERAVRDHQRRSGTPVQLELEELPPHAPLAVTIALYRSLQEALSNATRHGQGIAVRVRVWRADHQLCLTVADRGPGLTPGRADDERHLGVAGMRERARVLGGDFRLTSTAGEGTVVAVCWPLNAAQQSWHEEEQQTA